MSDQPFIETVVLRSGTKGNSVPLKFRPASVNVFVGPNHSGKSLLLRELQAAIQHPEQAPHRKVLGEINFPAWGEDDKKKLVDELRTVAIPTPTHPATHLHFNREHKSFDVTKDAFEIYLKQLGSVRDVGQGYFFREFLLAGSFLMLGGAERLAILNSIKREPPKRRGYYVHLLSRLFYSDAKQKVAQDIINEAFKCHLVIDPLGENFVAKISAASPKSGIERSPTDEAVDFFKGCTEIKDMSDGVRAFCGMVTAVVASNAKMILIDEPEAFLHPALCVKLARELCGLAQANGQQLFVATHSAAFLMGCVQAGIDLNIVRVTYRENAATSRLLPQQELVPLMRQPLLRSIGALTGIFYESVVVSEADSDRAFYDEINHRCVKLRHPGGIPECLFLNAQNWQTTARIIAPLRRLGIAAAAIVDIDLLLEGKSDSFQNLIEAAGMPPASRQAIGQLRGQLHAFLKPLDKHLKSQGISCVTGDNRRDLESFIDQIATHGIFVVPVGELEAWLPTIPRGEWNGKTEWLLRTFEAMGEDATAANYVLPSEGDVWNFMSRVCRWLHDPNRLGMPND